MTEKTVLEPEVKKEPVVTTPAMTVEELMSENTRLKDQNFKVLGEKKSMKAELDAELTDKEQRKSDALKKKGDTEALLDEANKKIANLTETITQKQESSLSKSIALEVQKLAGDAMDIADIIDKIDINDENIDIENETVTDLSTQIDKLRKDKPYFFDTKKTTMTTKLPNMGGISTGGGGDKKPLKRQIAESLMNKK